MSLLVVKYMLRWRVLVLGEITIRAKHPGRGAKLLLRIWYQLSGRGWLSEP